MAFEYIHCYLNWSTFIIFSFFYSSIIIRIIHYSILLMYVRFKLKATFLFSKMNNRKLVEKQRKKRKTNQWQQQQHHHKHTHTYVFSYSTKEDNKYVQMYRYCHVRTQQIKPIQSKYMLTSVQFIPLPSVRFFGAHSRQCKLSITPFSVCITSPRITMYYYCQIALRVFLFFISFLLFSL